VTDLEQVINAVEHGLIPSRKPGVRKRDLPERMLHYKVPRFSVVLIDQEEIAWARGCVTWSTPYGSFRFYSSSPAPVGAFFFLVPV